MRFLTRILAWLTGREVPAREPQPPGGGVATEQVEKGAIDGVPPTRDTQAASGAAAEQLEGAVIDLLHAGSVSEVRDLLERYPQLLTDAADERLEQIAEDAP